MRLRVGYNVQRNETMPVLDYAKLYILLVSVTYFLPLGTDITLFYRYRNNWRDQAHASSSGFSLQSKICEDNCLFSDLLAVHSVSLEKDMGLISPAPAGTSLSGIN